ncbi:hypothetical protein [Actinosynnema mirum]|nr:hypothetical protein [Actinosynnema mirum]
MPGPATVSTTTSCSPVGAAWVRSTVVVAPRAAGGLRARVRR